MIPNYNKPEYQKIRLAFFYDMECNRKPSSEGCLQNFAYSNLGKISDKFSEYKHVEAIYEFDDKKYRIGISQKYPIVYKYSLEEKELNDLYVVFSWSVEKKQKEAFYNFLLKQWQAKKTFNHTAFRWNFIPYIGPCLQYDFYGDVYFCSELIADALKVADILPDCIPHMMTPDDVNAAMVSSYGLGANDSRK